ncbi:MAG: TPR end-of-group domain-containing protein [Bryobacteraceae bacterium]
MYYSRQYDRAIAECRAVLSMDPRFALARTFAFYALLKEGKFQEALEEIEGGQGTGDAPGIWAEKAYLYGQWGRPAQAQHALVKFGQLAPQLHDRTQASIFAYIGTGRKDQAIALLQKAYSEHSNLVTSLQVDPRYDPLRDNPGFQELLRGLWPTP